MGAESIFINENLTSWRAELFKELSKKQKQRYPDGKAWTIDGKVFIKTNPSTKVRRIDSYKDLPIKYHHIIIIMPIKYTHEKLCRKIIISAYCK